MNDNIITYSSQDIPSSLFKAIVVPRPIGWVSSKNEQGIQNLAPFSYFNVVGDDPFTIMLSFTRKHLDSAHKDTLVNIETTKYFVINMVTFDLYHQMNSTATSIPNTESEFSKFNIPYTMSTHGDVQMVANSPIHLECTYFRSVDLPSYDATITNRMVLGVVNMVHINKHILDVNGNLDYRKCPLIARVGYGDYLTLHPDNFFHSKKP